MCLERMLPLHVELATRAAAALLIVCHAGVAKEPEVRTMVLSDQLCMCLEHRRPELGLHCLCPEAFKSL